MGPRVAILLGLVLTSCGSPDRGSSLFGDGTGGADAVSEGSPGEPTSGAAGSAADSNFTSGNPTDDGAKFDVTNGEGAGEGSQPDECGCGTDEWSYIWVANSLQSTVSKINTVTLQEEGRYLTRPDGAGNPSRTSVSLGGRAVAVANRYGGVVKVWAREQFCDPNRNGVAGLQTSSGANNVLPWGEDDCIDWYTAFDSYTTQRPVAWAGDVNPVSCDDEAVWTSGCGGGFSPGTGGFGNVFVHRLDGADGTVLDTVEVQGFTCGGFGAYGGAVDPEGNFWIAHNGTGGRLAKIDAATLQAQVFELPSNGFAGYGIAVDNAGRPWLSSYGGNLGAARFDPDSQSWTTVGGFASQGGIQQGADGRIWVASVSSSGAGQDGIVWIDPDTAQIGGQAAVGGGTVKGISLDVGGYVWAVTAVAHKIDPNTLASVGSYAGLTAPYTYSDMTGWGLQNNVCNPAG